MTRPVLRAPVAALLAAAAASGSACTATTRDVRETIVSVRPARTGGARMTMRTEYAPLVDGEIGLHFEADVPCTARFVEELTTTTRTVRTHTKAGWLVYGIGAGVAVAGIGTGLGLGFDGVKRDNLAANVSLTYGIYLLAASAAALGFNAIRVGDRTRSDGPFTRAKTEPVAECGPGPARATAVTVLFGRGAIDLTTGSDGAARFAPFELLDAFAPAMHDVVFAVTAHHRTAGEQRFDVGLSAAVLAAAAERFVAVKGLRPAGAAHGAAGAGPVALEASVALAGAGGGAVRGGAPAVLTARVRNAGATALSDVRLATRSEVAGWDSRYIYVGALAPGAEWTGAASLPGSALVPGATAAVALEPLAHEGSGTRVETSAAVAEPAAAPGAAGAPAAAPAPAEPRP